MDQTNEPNLDNEFKRYLQILRPHLCQLLDEDVIELCNGWIQRLSKCNENEKPIRNKYIFALCYQVAKGVLEEPFLRLPPLHELPLLPDEANSDNSSITEVECLVIDSESLNTNLLYNPEIPSTTHSDRNSRTEVISNKVKNYSKSDVKISHFSKCDECNVDYHHRANNLIMKLREIKKQNAFLRNELVILKEECKRRKDFDDSLDGSILKIDNATITYRTNQDSNTSVTSLKCRLEEVQYSRNNLIKTVDSLQDKLDKFKEQKNFEISEIEAKHKLEIIQLRSDIREEVKIGYENKIDALKKEHENFITEMNRSKKEEIDSLNNSNLQLIAEKDKLLQNKDEEIYQLKHQLELVKDHNFSILNKLIDTSNESSTEGVKQKSHELEKQLNKIEKSKNKCAKAFEAKLLSLQRDKHLTECSLQLQFIKQRAQVVNEMTDENQVELASAIDKLENKYKEIVANMQATAVQRRMQDQIALESLISAICDVQNEKSYVNPTNPKANQLPAKTIQNQCRDKEHKRDKEFENMCNSNRADSVLVGNKSYGENSIVTGYCIDSEKLNQLFERVQIPQRDVTNLSK